MSFEIIDSLFENFKCVDNEFDVLFDREDLNKGGFGFVSYLFMYSISCKFFSLYNRS